MSAPAPSGPEANRRLVRGIVAQTVSLAARVVVQLATLPLLFAFWPSELVGRWLMLFALPAYLSIFALSFAGVGGTAAIAALAAGDEEDARVHFRASWAIAMLGTLAFAAAAYLAMGLVPAASYQALAAAAGEDAALVLLALLLYVLGSAQVAVLAIPYRAVGDYPRHTLLSGLSVLADIPVIALAAGSGEGFVPLALGLALARWVFVAVLTVDSRRRAALFYTAPRPRGLARSFAQLWKPSLALMVMPVIFALNLQGYVVLIGAQFGAAALAGFVATRTLVRTVELVNNLAFAVQYGEAGYAREGKRDLQRRQLATATLLALLLVGGVALILLPFGDSLQRLFTSGKAAFDAPLAAVLLVAMLMRAVATTPEAIIAAENRHAPLVAIYFAGTVAALGAAVLLGRAGAPLLAVAAMAVLAEASQAMPSLAAALRHLGLGPGAFLRMLVSRERLADIAALLALIRRRA